MLASMIEWLSRQVVIAITTIGASGYASAPGTWPEVPEAAVNPACDHNAEQPMPELHRLYLRTDPRVRTAGRAIKGLYYATRSDGPNQVVAFVMACAGRLGSPPFLLFEFDTGAFLLDADGDGCVDGAGVLARGEIDPVEFLSALPAARRYCAPSE